jgi:8-oxo-dGTP pyrophosphatase MutT (NUDIX family)
VSAKRSTRVDFYHQADAPRPTTRNPSASAAVRDDAGRLLMLRRADTGLWTIPTGGLKFGETIAQCAARECREETGIEIEVTGLVGVFSDPGHVIVYRKGGKIKEVRQPVNICVHGRPVGGQIAPAVGEAIEVRWVDLVELAAIDVHPAIRKRIAVAVAEGAMPYVD